MSPQDPLTQLDAAIETRVATIRAAHPDWLCGKGCDACCRRLATLPQLTPPEAERLRAALAALPASEIAAIRARLAALGPAPKAPVTCPLLDPASGACPVYAARPVACRSYGFYVERDKGLYCAEIEALVAAGAYPHAVWGNHAPVDAALAGLGPVRPLDAWLATDAPTPPEHVPRG